MMTAQPYNRFVFVSWSWHLSCNGNQALWKIWKETALIELWSYYIDILAFEPGKLCPGVGILFGFSTRGPEFYTEKLTPVRGFRRKKLVARGMVTGQIDTCITNRVTWSVLEIRSPHFYARPSQDRAVRKRSGFVFPSTDRVTRLVNR